MISVLFMFNIKISIWGFLALFWLTEEFLTPSSEVIGAIKFCIYNSSTLKCCVMLLCYKENLCISFSQHFKNIYTQKLLKEFSHMFYLYLIPSEFIYMTRICPSLMTGTECQLFTRKHLKKLPLSL